LRESKIDQEGGGEHEEPKEEGMQTSARKDYCSRGGEKKQGKHREIVGYSITK